MRYLYKFMIGWIYQSQIPVTTPKSQCLASDGPSMAAVSESDSIDSYEYLLFQQVLLPMAPVSCF